MKIANTLIGIVLVVSGCASQATSTETQASESAASSEQNSAPGANIARTREQRVQKLRALLVARHTADLPTHAVLERHSGADETLRWLATEDQTQVIRVRALTLLQHYPDEQTRTLLLEVARLASLPTGIRAAALRGMVGFDLAQEAELRNELVTGLKDGDAMRSVAAVQILAAQSSTLPLVREAATDPQLPQVTRQAAERELVRVP